MVATDNGIYISDKAKEKVYQLMKDAGVENDSSYFLRVGVVGGGCSGLSYKLDFDNEVKPMDQVFEDKGVKIVTDLKSFLYLVNTELEFSDGLNGKGFHFSNPNASRSCGCGESFSV
jgi:iron-sulfur cluster assembly protein